MSSAPAVLVLAGCACAAAGCRSVAMGDVHCRGDEHCPPGWYCDDDGLCAQDCSEDDDCPQPGFCDATGQCQDLPADVACPHGSGWPCTCHGGECDDGTPCLALEDLADGGTGVCMAECDCDQMPAGCPPTDFDPDSRCGAHDSENETCRCLLSGCAADGQCPPGQLCRLEPNSGKLVCHP